MNSRRLVCVLLIAFPLAAAGQQTASAVSASSHAIQLDVVVNATSGQGGRSRSTGLHGSPTTRPRALSRRSKR